MDENHIHFTNITILCFGFFFSIFSFDVTLQIFSTNSTLKILFSAILGF